MKLMLAVLMVSVVVGAGTRGVTAEQAAASPAAVEPAAPKIGEIMVLQQLRHIKLWFAGRAGNWPLAGYELDELKEGFDDLNQVLGGDTVEKAVGGGIASIEKAVEAKDRAAFANAFDNLTAGCNSCHHLLERAFIVIQRPTALPYSDQFFAPQK